MGIGAEEDSGCLLFAYGSLLLTTGLAEVDAAMRDAGVSLGRAFVSGRLFDLGAYPGAVPLNGNPRNDLHDRLRAYHYDQGDAHEDAPKVWGRLIRLKDPAAFFSVIDSYEGFVAGDPAASEFVRARTRVFAPGSDRGMMGQVYWFNQATEGRQRIEGGDYLAHWHARGRRAQGRVVDPGGA